MTNEEKAQEYSKQVANGHCYRDLCIGFRDGAEWKEQQMIDKAVKWLEKNVWEYTGLDYSALTESFINAMKRE